jgi:hypothetical protein
MVAEVKADSESDDAQGASIFTLILFVAIVIVILLSYS